MPGRVFVAIELPPAARDLLASALRALTREAPPWAREKVVSPDLLHVTLAFIGPVPDGEIDGFVDDLRRAVASCAPFELCLDHVVPVPSYERASMVWAALQGDVVAAAKLAASLSAAAGLPAERRPFAAHVTLARARTPRRLPVSAIAAADAALSARGKEADKVVSVRSATVFSSTLGSGGPVYERVATLGLDAGVSSPGID